MYIPDLNEIVKKIDGLVWSWPLLAFVSAVGIILTVALNFVQFRYFFSSIRYSLTPPTGKQSDNYITPFQAFLNTLNASIGNGSTAGMATAIVSGGPGAAFWVFVLGFLYMVIRYAEVYASIAFQEEAHGVVRGGPMVYLKKLPAGKMLAYVYALFCLGLSVIGGNAMQCNSITVGVERLTGLSPYVIAAALFGLLLYIMFGGASRIIRVAEAIVPVKVGLFFIATLAVLGYHYAAIIPALKLIMAYAFTSKAVLGGALGFSVQQAMRYGMVRSLNATESGLGTAGILYGSTRGQEPVINGIMSMATSFISSHLVCFTLMVVLIATGVWDSGLQSTQLVMAAYESVFGAVGSVIVAFLAVTFGLGVLVAYAYIGRECWNYITGGRFQGTFTLIYCLMALFGALAKVELVWNATGIVNAGMVIINLVALLYLLPQLRRGLQNWEQRRAL